MNTVIGQYYPQDSIIHKLDARVKIIVVFLFLTFIFISKTYLGNTVSLLFLIGIILFSKIPLSVILKSLKPLVFIIIFTLVTNILLSSGETVLFQISFIKITKEGVQYAFRIMFRLVILIVGSSMLTFTTSTLEFADAVEDILSPLKKIKFPAHEVSMMITIAIRFIPTILEEVEKIKKAQMCRGVDFENGSLIKRIKNFVPIFIPLFISAFKRADELSVAMESRCYRGDINRTKLKVFKLKKNDYIFIFISLVYFVSIVILRFTVER